ncbi:hypothetical protein BHM03_00014693, partial [Ensete ventricosum]
LKDNKDGRLDVRGKRAWLSKQEQIRNQIPIGARRVLHRLRPPHTPYLSRESPRRPDGRPPRRIAHKAPEIARAEMATEMACLSSLVAPRRPVLPSLSPPLSSARGRRAFAPPLRSRCNRSLERLSRRFRATADQQGPDEQKLLEASMAYVSGNPIMTDAEFDELKLRLKVHLHNLMFYPF